MAEFTVMADNGDLCGEAPVWDAGTDTLFWTDCVGLRFCALHESSGKHEIVKEGLEINEGRFFAGSCFYDATEKYELGKLIRVDPDGKACVVDDGIHLANGLGFSPDEKTLYFSDSAARRIYAYDYDRASGNVRNRRVFVQVPANEGIPDGLTVDAAGFVWSAQWYGSCIVRYDPDGRMERRIHVPATQTSSVAFGSKGLVGIFVTSAAKSWASPLMPDDAQSGCFGGALYRINLDVVGKLDYKANIKLGCVEGTR